MTHQMPCFYMPSSPEKYTCTIFLVPNWLWKNNPHDSWPKAVFEIWTSREIRILSISPHTANTPSFILCIRRHSLILCTLKIGFLLSIFGDEAEKLCPSPCSAKTHGFLLHIEKMRISSLFVFCNYAQFYSSLSATMPINWECGEWHWKFPGTFLKGHYSKKQYGLCATAPNTVIE